MTDHTLSLAAHSAVMAGQMEAFSDEIEKVKRDFIEQYATANGDLEAQLAWTSLDRIVCVMRESVDTWTAINHREMEQQS